MTELKAELLLPLKMVCHDAVDISPFLAELAHETGCFESGDPAADSYDNVLIFKHHA